MKVKTESEVTQLCLILSDLIDCSLPGSSVHGIFQARVLEWGVIAFSVRSWGFWKLLLHTWIIWFLTWLRYKQSKPSIIENHSESKCWTVPNLCKETKELFHNALLISTFLTQNISYWVRQPNLWLIFLLYLFLFESWIWDLHTFWFQSNTDDDYISFIELL